MSGSNSITPKKGEINVLHHNNTVIRITDQLGPLYNASIFLKAATSDATESIIPVRFIENLGVYIIEEPFEGDYYLRVTCEGYYDQTLPVVFYPYTKQTFYFILSKTGEQEYYYLLANTQIPYIPATEERISLTFKEGINKEKLLEIENKLLALGLVKAGDNLQEGSLYTLSVGGSMEDREIEIIDSFANDPVEINPVLQYEKRNIFLHSRLTIRFKRTASEEDIRAFLEEYDLQETGSSQKPIYEIISSSTRTYKQLLYLSFELRQNLLVETIDSNVFSHNELLSVTPNDYLYKYQWDFKLINIEGAWEQLRTKLGEEKTFGSPNVIAAVVDAGFDYSHPSLTEYTNPVKNKKYIIYDFDSAKGFIKPPFRNNHGTNCASVGFGWTNKKEGTSGIAGNCRIMTLTAWRAVSTPESFAWAAKFKKLNHSNLPENAAEILSVSMSSDKSIHMEHVIDGITTYGRKGKGTLIFCAAGNGTRETYPNPPMNSNRFNIHPKLIIVGASSLNKTDPQDNTSREVIAYYSMTGNNISFCAPSGNVFPGLAGDNIDNDLGTYTAANRWNSEFGTIKTTVIASDTVNQSPVVSLDYTIEDEFLNIIDDDDVMVEGENGILERHPAKGESVVTIQGAIGNKGIIFNPPVKIGGTAYRLNGRCHGKVIIETTLKSNASKRDGAIQITNFPPELKGGAGYAVIIDPDNPLKSESHAIQIYDEQVLYLMKLLKNDFTAGTKVHIGYSDYNDNTKGTSYSTPVCAGVAALCLSVNPNLSWIELRHIIRSTARKINLDEKGWTDDIRFHPQNAEEKQKHLEFARIYTGTGKWVNTEGNGIMDADKLFLPDKDKFVTFVSANQDRDILTLSAVAGFEKGQAIEIRQRDLSRSLLRVITKIDSIGKKITLDAPVENNFNFTDSKIYGGLKPVYSQYYGYGRVDASEAVKATFEWKSTQLLIRDYPTDIGTYYPESRLIHSPDIWVTNDIHDMSVLVPPPRRTEGYSDKDFHESPLKNNARTIHIRIKNLSNELKESNLDTWVRCYIALSSGKAENAEKLQDPSFTSYFSFSERNIENDWYDYTNISKIENTEKAGTYYVGEVMIPEGQIEAANDSDPNAGTITTSFSWEQNLLPDFTSTEWDRIFILAHISPFHGILAGSGAHNNPCLSYREITFATYVFYIHDEDLERKGIPKRIEIADFDGSFVQEFQIEVNREIGYLSSDILKLEVRRTHEDGTEERAVWYSKDGTWDYEEENQDWEGLHIDDPEIDGIIMAGENPATVTFKGHFSVSSLHTKVILIPQILSTYTDEELALEDNKPDPVVISSQEFTIEVVKKSNIPTGIAPELLASPPPPESYAFADMDRIIQDDTSSYGPVKGKETTEFRATSLFKAKESFTDINAYAITSGFALLQPGEDDNTVNLVLKPFKQPVIGFTPVKYFVYRGLHKKDFLNEDNENEIIPANENNSEFIKQQRKIYRKNQVEPAFIAKALGYDPSAQANDSILDYYFFRQDEIFQLPFATKGMQLGRFHEAHSFGIDIILEEGTYEIQLDQIRRSSFTVDISQMPGISEEDKFSQKLRREEILNYIDPSAYYGLHIVHDGTVYTHDRTNGSPVSNRKEKIFSAVINNFHTRNTIYIDIRNENGHSYNFYRNYSETLLTDYIPPEEPAVSVKLSTGLTGMPPAFQQKRSYETNGWPLLIMNFTEYRNLLFCAFCVNDNIKPMLYVEEGKVNTIPSYPRFINEVQLNVYVPVIPNKLPHQNPPPPWTTDIGFELPGIVMNNLDYTSATILKLFYTRSTPFIRPDKFYSSKVVWPEKIVKTSRPIDNVFGNINFNTLLDLDKRVNWINARDKKYIDLFKLLYDDESIIEEDFEVYNINYISERGVAVGSSETNNGTIIFYSIGTDYPGNISSRLINGITGGVSTKGDFFEVANFFQEINFEFEALVFGTQKILTMRPVPNGKRYLQGGALLLVCITPEELTVLSEIIQDSFSNSPVNLKLKYRKYTEWTHRQFYLSDNSGKDFREYYIKLDGLDKSGKYQSVIPNSIDGREIVLYSKNNTQFFSEGFSKSTVLSLLPVSYKRDMEENRGLFKINNTDTFCEDFFIKKDNESVLKYREKNAILTEISDRTDSIVQAFIAAIEVVNDNQGNAKVKLKEHIDYYCSQLLKRSRGYITNKNEENADDRILYWARNKMKVALRNHKFMLPASNTENILDRLTERDELLEEFEASSRGYNDVDFTPVNNNGIKKILIIGFDPSFPDPVNGAEINLAKSSPSGATALALHNQFIMNGGVKKAYIQSIILPLRYFDLDKNTNSGIIEEVCTKLIKKTNDLDHPVVDIAVVLDETNDPQVFELGRFASYKRGKTIDNQGAYPAKTIVHFHGQDFYETVYKNLNLIVSGSPDPSSPYYYYYNQTFAYEREEEYNENGIRKTRTARVAFTKNRLEGNQTIEELEEISKDDLPVGPGTSNIIIPLKGSVGDSFGNECFYRLSNLSANSNIESDKKSIIGIVSLPLLKGDLNEETRRTKIKEVIDRLSKIIASFSI